jgi:hypothetical protein
VASIFFDISRSRPFAWTKTPKSLAAESERKRGSCARAK